MVLLVIGLLVAPGPQLGAAQAAAAKPRVTLTVSAGQVTAGSVVTLGVGVRRGVRGQRVRVQQWEAGSWRTVAQRRLNKKGRLAANVPVPLGTPGGVDFRVRIARSGRAKAVASAPVRVQVIRPPSYSPPPLPPVETGWFQAVYAVPADQPVDSPAVEAHRAKIAKTVDEVNGWFTTQTIGGVVPRFLENAGGEVAVRVIQLPLTTAQLAVAKDSDIRAAVRAVWPAARDRKDMVFVREGVGTPSCGDGDVGGDYALVAESKCEQSVTGSDWPGGASYAVAHKLAHLFGAVPVCAPHHDAANRAHVTGPGNDLLVASKPADLDPAATIVLDAGRDDYYGHGRADCPDMAASAWWGPAPQNPATD